MSHLPTFARELLDLPPEASTVSADIDGLHALVIGSTMVGTVAVAAFTVWFLIRYRRKSEQQLTNKDQTSGKVELTLGAAILLVFCTFWLLGFKQYVDLQSPPANALSVYVTAKQWMWKFSYPDGRSASDVLTVPAGRPVKLIMTSRDVIHSFYVPAFRVKHDVLPGRYVSLWFEPNTPGEYDIFCAEYCGLNHSNMRGTVRVLGPDDYARWLSNKSHDASGEADLILSGKAAAQRRACVTCHTTDGQATNGPSWARIYGSTSVLEDGRRVLVDDEYLTRSIMEPNADIVAGYKPIMPTYFGIIDQPEVAAIVAYIRSLRSGGPAPGVALPRLNDAGQGAPP